MVTFTVLVVVVVVQVVVVPPFFIERQLQADEIALAAVNAEKHGGFDTVACCWARFCSGGLVGVAQLQIDDVTVLVGLVNVLVYDKIVLVVVAHFVCVRVLVTRGIAWMESALSFCCCASALLTQYRDAICGRLCQLPRRRAFTVRRAV